MVGNGSGGGLTSPSERAVSVFLDKREWDGARWNVDVNIPYETARMGEDSGARSGQSAVR
eukprot:COSAG02_NODE_4224_length_5613_cov_38.092087_3_plen_60_part_00